MAWGRNKTGALKPQELDRAWRRALRAAVSGDWSAAESWLERIVETDTNDLDAYHALARLYREQGAVGRAIRMHQNLLLRDDLGKEGRADALGELARDFEAGGYAERAVASYEERLDLQPKHTETLERLVCLLRDLQEYPRVASLIRRLRRRDRERADALEGEILLSLARARAREGDQSAARAALKRCLRRTKEAAEAHALMGDLEAERGKTAKAIEAWKRATESDPELGSALYPKIDAGYAAIGKSPDYERFLRSLLESRPTDSAARIALARALGARGDATTAVEELARAIEVTPDDLALRAELGRQLISVGNETEAIKAYADLVEQIDRPDAEETVL